MHRTTIAALAGLAVTAAILLTPYLTFGFRSPSAHLVLNSLDACIALLVAYLLHGRFLRSRRLQDVLLSQGMVLLLLGSLGGAFASRLVPDQQAGTLDVWLPLSVRMMGALVIGAAAVAGARRVGATRLRWPALPTLGAVAAVSMALWLARDRLPVALDLEDLPATAQYPLLTGHPVLLAAQALAALCFFLAAAVFTVQAARHSEDELLLWLGPACAVGAFARVNYLLFPSLYTDWLYTGDVLRTGCYLLLLVGAMREIQQYWSAQADVAVLEDRRRLARELHDGVVQELGYIKSQGYSIPVDSGAREPILGACDRALDEARAAVHALGSADDEPLSWTLERAAKDIANRYDVALHMDLDDSVHVTSEQRHALARITREAMANAVRHGAASEIRLQLEQRADGWRLCIRDDGLGFEPAALSSVKVGYGLVSMRDRAQALPGSFAIDSAPGAGSTVSVTW